MVKKFKVGQTVLLALAIGAIPAGTAGVVSEVVKEGCQGDYSVRTCGVDLILNEGDLIEPVESGANSGASSVAGINGKQLDKAGSSVGENNGAGTVDAGANVAAADYSVAQAVSDLEALAVGVGFEKDEYILDIAEKLKTIAA